MLLRSISVSLSLKRSYPRKKKDKKKKLRGGVQFSCPHIFSVVVLRMRSWAESALLRSNGSWSSRPPRAMKSAARRNAHQITRNTRPKLWKHPFVDYRVTLFAIRTAFLKRPTDIFWDPDVPSEIIRLVLRHFGRCAKRIRNERIKTEPISDVSKAPISGSKYLDRRFGKFPARTKRCLLARY